MPVTRKATRYELELEGGTAFALFHEEPGAVVVTHSEVPAALRGRGLGGELVRGMLDDIAARGLKVVPRCGFVAGFIARNPHYRALLR